MTEMASFANLQKNTAREKAAAREYAISKFAEDLVANLDVLGMALQAVPVEKRTAEGTAEVTKEDLANLWTGVQMTMKELEATLKRAGVTPFESVGEKFDPNKHEALYQVDMPDKTPGTVFQCSQRVRRRSVLPSLADPSDRAGISRTACSDPPKSASSAKGTRQYSYRTKRRPLASGGCAISIGGDRIALSYNYKDPAPRLALSLTCL
jgi:hypothetical protein